MPIFYRGAGLGTVWHAQDATVYGFTPRNPGLPRSPHRIINHIAQGTANTPFISLTRSFPVARDYALKFGRVPTLPTQSHPAYVYEIEIDVPPPAGVEVIDPLVEIAKSLPHALDLVCYHHDGPQTYLLGLVDPQGRSRFLRAPLVQLPHGGPPKPPSTPSPQLKALVCTLRDGELLAYGSIPAHCVVNRHSVW